MKNKDNKKLKDSKKTKQKNTHTNDRDIMNVTALINTLVICNLLYLINFEPKLAHMAFLDTYINMHDDTHAIKSKRKRKSSTE